VGSRRGILDDAQQTAAECESVGRRDDVEAHLRDG
jgi:hypothetical protein